MKLNTRKERPLMQNKQPSSSAQQVSSLRYDLSEIRINKTVNELIHMGHDVRDKVPFEKLAQFRQVNRDVVSGIEHVESKLISELLPLRHKRLAASPFSFFRGTDELMAYDLSNQESSNIPVVISGDAHIGNFGFYASPERKLLFDLNDFDESTIGAWDWDIRRLLVSVILAGEQLGLSHDKISSIEKAAVETYQEILSQCFDDHSALERYYFSTEVESFLKAEADGNSLPKLWEKIKNSAVSRDSEKVVKKFTTIDTQGHLVFRENPPKTVHVSKKRYGQIVDHLQKYLQTVSPDVAVLLSQFHISDIVRHSVGVGSFGTRCYLVLLTAIDGSHLVLQIKEALQTRRFQGFDVTTKYSQSGPDNGERIITCQQVLQRASDPFLGFYHNEDTGRSFYVRQFWDMKESVNLEKMDEEDFANYAKICALLLARGHAQSPTAGIIHGYIGKKKKLANSLVTWSNDYAKQVHKDYQLFKEAFDTGKLAREEANA
ncbi:DUF2252 domain-containing protein [Lentilactobacillus hilgardii]|jgi:uncharacterized protein (DUF2252 family)|uniref:DUF2252 domain-containing protein n=2 Tax=Lentilactobacillus hilgardii TaxID=1588 RepID=A0A6P1E4Z4_LENHI|nr:hypothetical protein HMPREF0496_0808 [Lentilactobacillus hilgardii ATCC 27305]MCT3390958.1 DUF2252 domain-containing protein [Lentilactobacillus hilgardii]QHB51170.1 DUF2252 domain-containing protein [Lentilactobacillus hilgardii]RRG12248.1 MAG: DUF2252 domain-containing protein [Lactobacillus sp.]